MHEVEQLRELLTTKLDHQTETLGRIERQTTRTNGRVDELETQMATANSMLAVAVERLNTHDREFRDIKKTSGGALTWREARIVITATSVGGSIVWGAVKGVEWLVHALRQP